MGWIVPDFLWWECGLGIRCIVLEMSNLIFDVPESTPEGVTKEKEASHRLIERIYNIHLYLRKDLYPKYIQVITLSGKKDNPGEK